MENFSNPENKYRGTDFFMLNDALTEEDLRFQIAEMSKRGVASFIARTYIGLKSDYPGKDFMSKMRIMIDEAKKHSITVFIQAGYMPEAVLDLPQKFSLDYLCVHYDGVIPSDESFLCEYENTVYSCKSSVTCLNLFDADSVAFYIRQSYDLWQPFKSDFGKTISSIWVDEPSYHSEHLPWFCGFDKIFSDKYGYDIKSQIYKLYRDIDDFKKVRYDYWTLLNKLLENCYFSMIRQWCNDNGIMFSGHLMMEDTLFSQIKRACTVMPYYKYFDIPGLDILRGYMNWNNDPIIDLAGTDFFDEHMYTTPLQTVSAAHQAGKEQILCEMYGVTTNGMGFRDFEYYFDHFASLGVNYRSVHGIFYSLKGRSKRQYPPHVNYYQPYWDNYNDVTDYCARTSKFISQGKPYANVLVIHPLETAYMYFRGDDGEPVPSEEMKLLDKRFCYLLRTLLHNHISFELGDINTIATDYGSVDIDNKRFVVGCMSYDTIVLPYLEVLNKETIDKISQFMACGGRVVALGDMPTMVDGKVDKLITDKLKDTVQVNSLSQLCRYLSCATPEEYRLESDTESGNVRVYHTQDGKNRYYMLFNSSCKISQNVRLYVKGNFDAEILDAQNGDSHKTQTSFNGVETEIKTTIPQGGNSLIFLKPSENGKRHIETKPIISSVVEVDNSFEVKRRHPNVLLLEFCSFKTEKMQEFEGDYTILAINRFLTDENYIGNISLRYRFVSEKPIKNLSLAIEDAAEWEVVLNGVRAEKYDGTSYYFAKAFGVICLPDACKTGENIIEIKRHFSPLSKARSSITSLFETQLGVELESAYLLGDFGTYAVSEPTMNGSLRYDKDVVLSTENKVVTGELTSNGYIFYAGTMSFTKNINISSHGYKRADLRICDFHGCVAQVFVNEIYCGNVSKPPYITDITKALSVGNNVIRIELTNTLRPILGPYHRPRGEIGECWGGYGDPDLSWTGSALGKDWYKKCDVDSSVWTNSYNQVRFGISDIKIILSD